MALLAIAFVIVGFAVDAADAASRPALEAADLALTAVFVAEIAARCVVVGSRHVDHSRLRRRVSSDA